MTQLINLYLPEFRVKKDPLTAVLMGQILGGVLVLMVLVSSFDLLTRWQLNAQLENLRIELTEETRKTNELDDLLARRSQNDELNSRLETAEVRLVSRRQIHDFLSETQLGNVEGFSDYFKDLSRAAIDGLSLSEFQFTRGGEEVLLAGQVTDSAMVPRYVSNLQRGSSALRGKRFSPNISRSNVESQYFQFSLSSGNE